MMRPGPRHLRVNSDMSPTSYSVNLRSVCASESTARRHAFQVEGENKQLYTTGSVCYARVCVCVCVCVCARARVCARACVCVCVRFSCWGIMF